MDSARRSAAVVFAATGAVTGAWASRLPALQAGLGLSPAELSVVVLGVEGGALAGLPAGGALVTRHGSRRCLRAAFAIYATALAAAALAPSLLVLTAVAAVMAAANSVVDVAANAAGVALERRAGRPVLPGLHAAHSTGVAVGGASGVAAGAIGASVPAHFALLAAVALAAGVIAGRSLEGGSRCRDAPSGRPGRRLRRVGALAFCALLVEGVGSNWSAVHLRSALDAAPALASAAFTGFAVTLALGRVIAGRLVDRWGRRAIAGGAGLATAAGACLVVAAPSPPLAIAGWGAVGLTVAGITPVALAAAPDAAEADDATMPPATAIATATMLGYAGSFSGPPVVGAIAGAVGLSPALALLVPAALGIAALAGPALGAPTPRRRSDPVPPLPARPGRRR